MALTELIKQPRTIAECGLDAELLLDLTLKHLYDGGVLDLRQLSARMALSGNLIEGLLLALRKEMRIETLAATEHSAGVRFQLTDLGRAEAKNACLRSGYIGRAPVPLEHYQRLVAAQSVFNGAVGKEQLKSVLAEAVIDERLLDQLGPALHSGRAMMVYGPAGSGKTFICKRLARCLGEPVYMPYAIAVSREIVQLFDPLLHVPVDSAGADSTYQLADRADPRLIRCERPMAVSGGELTMNSLELRYDSATRLNYAPIQLKANNGIYLVDDLGRQRMPAIELLNRWIIPMEDRIDYLTLASGRQFSVPFDTVLMFSTNLNPLELVDEAYLRRLGYKIQFSAVSKELFTRIWQNVCSQRRATVEDGVLDCVIELYERSKRLFLPCQPRDLIGIALDIAAFNDRKGILSKESMMLAWDTYFTAL
ncbi:MAG: hypothetical protein ACXWF8_09945 [Methylobacter sp.]